MKHHTVSRFCSWLVAILVGNSALAANVADFVDFSLRDLRGRVVLPGRLYVPPEAAVDPTISRPFILFLHGGGEVGTNNVSQINVNIDNLLAEAKMLGAIFMRLSRRRIGTASR